MTKNELRIWAATKIRDEHYSACAAMHVCSSIMICLRLAMLVAVACWADVVRADDRVEFFEKRVRPALIEHCYPCHSAQSKELQGGLRLDIKAGWQAGGDSGEPAVIAGKPNDSLLVRSIEHAAGTSPMPPKQAKLPADVIADLRKWIEAGAVDPREGEMAIRDKQTEWETVYQQRLNWWSLKPLAQDSRLRTNPTEQVSPPAWSRNEVDDFILSRLQLHQLQPNAEADKAILARRLSVALTGLPVEPQLLATYLNDSTDAAYDNLVTSLLDSPHFGERWARHWMDVVHYTDTHGYEWDVPVKNAWRYRDYLIRAFNDDLSYQRLILEQLAGDLLPPRIDPSTGVNQALIGPLMLRLGERRHGDNSAAEGISQEAVANMIDTIGKAFLGTTLACAQCHDHKLDAVEQRDYYSLAGMLMSTRFSARPIDVPAGSSSEANLAIEHNQRVIAQLRPLKQQIKSELARRWLQSTAPSSEGELVQRLRAIPVDAKQDAAFPSTILGIWKRSLTTAIKPEEITQEREKRVAANQANLKLLADFSVESPANPWRWEGMGMQFGLVGDGELTVSDEGDKAITQLLPAGRYTHVWSTRLAGLLQSPQLDPTAAITFSLEGVAGKFASQSFIVDRALNPERLAFPKRPFPAWQTLTAGNFDSLEGTIDRSPRRVYFELATKSLNNYFPPRVGYGGASEAEVNDPRSWFGVSRIVQHAPDKPPQDELARFQPLVDEFADQSDWALKLTLLLRKSIERWAEGSCLASDVQLLNDAIQSQLLPIDMSQGSETERLVLAYRAKEREIREDQTVGTVAEWQEGHDERLAVRGVYTDLGNSVARSRVRFLSTATFVEEGSSGRWQWAKRIADESNPLTARVYVNRVWHYLFGAGLVRTTDDFGHLGELPSHPELLDYLARRFIKEGWSTKQLVRLLVSSATWRQSSVPRAHALEIDPENRLWHHLPIRRLEAEAPARCAFVSIGMLGLAVIWPQHRALSHGGRSYEATLQRTVRWARSAQHLFGNDADGAAEILGTLQPTAAQADCWPPRCDERARSGAGHAE